MLFGTGSAKFERSGSTVLLEHSILKTNFVQRNISTITSIYDHYNTYIFHGDYSDFNVTLHLYKYNDPTAKYSEIYPYLFTYVYFWPHADGTAISGSNNRAVPFFIDSIQHNYLDENDASKDVLNIHFKSISYTNLTGSLI